METILNTLTSNRFKSFYWRTSMMIIAGLITVIINSFTDLGITGELAVVLGLILGEISKAINNKLNADNSLSQ